MIRLNVSLLAGLTLLCNSFAHGNKIPVHGLSARGPTPRCDYKYEVLPQCDKNNRLATLVAPVSVQDCVAACLNRNDCASIFFWNVDASNNGCHLYSADSSTCADVQRPVGGNTGWYDRTCAVGPPAKCNQKYDVLSPCDRDNKLATLSAPISVRDCMAYCQVKDRCASIFFWNVDASNNGCHLFSANSSQCADTSRPVGGNTAWYDLPCNVGLPVQRCNYKYDVLSQCSTNSRIATLPTPGSIQNCMAYCQLKNDCASIFYWNINPSNNGCHLFSSNATQCADTSKPITENAGWYDRACNACTS